MSDDDKRPTHGERYASACDSSDLRMRPGGGDVDYLIAAGLVEDGLATSLYRLTTEYDAQRGPIDEARRWLANRVDYANGLRNEAKREGSLPDSNPERVAALLDEAETAQRVAHAAMRTEFLMALASMKTLAAAKERLREFATEQARRKRVDLTLGAIAHLSWRVLDVFLEPKCSHCTGRGFVGGGRHEHSGPQRLCTHCRATGSRREAIGQNHAERLFAGHLIMSMDASMYDVQQAIGRNRRLVDAANGLMTHPHPSECEHLHVAYRVMLQAAAALSARPPEEAGQP